MAGLKEPLSERDYERLAVVLERGADAMDLEMLDGFLVALICSPDIVPPSEYLPAIWGGDEPAWRDEKELQDFMELMLRHWNGAVRTLNSGEPYLPYLLEDDAGIAHGNDWAQGFTRGMKLRSEDWAELLGDDDHGGLLVPILALAHEHDPDPEMRPYKGPMNRERREQLIANVCTSVPAIYRYFVLGHRVSSQAERERAAYHRADAKVGRNDPCPCGSGKKFKKCCGAVTLH
jgi:uncharacterized protein